jgi:hypothetical protein
MNKYTFTCAKRASFLPQLFQKTLFVFLFLITTLGAWGQIFTDNASNYGASWTNSSNLGTGFGAWSLSAGANSGSFLGNPSNNGMGTTGIGTNAFGLFATGSAYMNALRPFSAAMEVGDKFTFYWAINWDANGGGKGFDLRSGGTTIFNVNNFNSSTITTTNGNAFTTYGTSPMLVTLIRTSSTQYSFRMTARDGGSDYTTTINSSSSIDRINFYIGNQNNGDGNRNMYFNHLTIEKGRYRSKVSGAWNNASTWQVSTDGGSTWADANSAPSNSNGPITILNTHEVTVSTTITIDETTINSGGKIILATGGSITVANGADANDLIINGTYERQATATSLTPTGTVFCGSGGTYIHNASGGTLPTLTWNANSTLQIDANLAADQFTQSFGNVTVNNSAAFFISTTSGAYTGSIQGNFTHNSSGAISLKNSSWDATFTIGGNLSISGGGTFRIMEGTGVSSTRNQKVIINGNFSLSNGTLNLSNETSSTVSASSVFGLLEVKGNFTHTGGVISETASDGDVVTRITLTGSSGTQTIESTGQTGTVNFNVAGSNAQCVISTTKTFTLSSGSSMTIGAGTSAPDLSVSGTFLNQSSTALTVASATITINNGGTYVHNTTASAGTPLAVASFSIGSTMIYRGSSTLTPSISLSGRTYHHLIIESTSGNLSLSGTGGSSLIVNGDLTVGANCTFNPNVTATPGHSIKGNISIGSGGTLNYNPATAGTINLNGSGTQTISGAGTFTTGANATLAVGASSTIDFGATNAIAGSGTFTTASGSTLITANANGINGSLTLTNKTLNAGTNYIYNGTSAQVTGAAVTSANNLTLNNSNGLTLSANTSVTGTLTLTNGKLTTNGFTIALTNAVSGASASNYIVADAAGTAIFNGVSTARVFPLGTSSAYAPVTITAGSSTNYTAYVTASLPCSATDATKMVNLAWGLSGSNTPSQVVFQWPASSQAASFTPASSCDLGRYNASCPYNVTNIGAASGTGPYTLTTTSGLSSTNNIYVIGNENAVYIAAPTVTTTVAASSISNTSASSGGQTITGINITEKGVVWNTSTTPTIALTTKTNDGTGSANFTSSLTSLSPQTLYYIRAFATNAAGTAYGDEKTFRTLSNPATAQATSLTATATSSSNIDLSWNAATFPSSGASAKGYVLLRAMAPNTPALGNVNGSAPTAGANTNIVSSTIGEGDVSFSNSGLASSTQYNYLLIPYTWDNVNASTYNYLTTSAPTASATTTSGATPPVLTTSSASSVTAVAATLNGDITSDGGGSVTTRGFVYSSSDNTPTLGESGVTDQTSGSGIGTFNASVSALTPNTTYYYQAYATNASGTSYGGVVSFTAPKAEPTAQPTSLVFSSITTSTFSTAFTAATGSPDGYLVIRSTSASLSANPVDGTTYTVGNSLGGGTIVSVGSSISGISNTGLSSGTTYYTFVFAYNNSGATIDYLIASPLSSSTITLSDVPATPTFSSITTTGFTVDWTSTSGASSYKLDVSTASNFASFVIGYQDLTVNANSQAVTGLTANTLYYVRIRAVNASGTSANSSTANSPTLPNAPTVGNASSITTSGLTANWSAPSAQGAVTFTYTVELSTASDFSIITSTVSNIASGTTSSAFTGLLEGTTFYYRVRAVNSAGNSAWSAVSAGAMTLTSAISLTALGTNFTQDFNTLASSGTSSGLPAGWYLSESGTNANSIYTSSTGSITGGDTYSFGSSSDRAFGGLRSGTLIPVIGAKYSNNTGAEINVLTISYTGETWRVGTSNRSDRMDFQYSLDATILTNGNWIDMNTLDYENTGQAAGSGSVLHSTSINNIISGLTIPDGAKFMIRWIDFDASSSDDGMGIDDFSIKPCGTVSAPTASDQAFCSAAASTVANLAATGTAIQWYASSTGGTALASPTALSSTTYYSTQTISGCESVSRTPVVVIINTNPSAPTGNANQAQCSGATVSNLSATGSSIQWYAAASGGTALATNTAIVNGTTYYASQTTNSCESTNRLAVTSTIVNSGSWIGTASSDWSDAANWCGGVPTSSTSVTIPSGTPFPLVISTSVSVNAITINAGATVSATGTPTITITNNGSFTNFGTFTAGTSKVSFAGAGTVSGTVGFNDVDLAGGVNFGTASTINGTLTINANGFVNNNAPSYGPSSKLRYNTGGTYGRGFEWGTTSGTGFPNDVQISNNTTLNYPNSAGNFSATIGVARDITIDAGSKLYMDFGTGSASGELIIGRHINIAGDLSLGDAFGGDIYLGGDWVRTSGNFNANNRAVFFNGTSGDQSITNAAGESFPFVIVDKLSGNVILNNNVTITGGLTLTKGLVDIGSNNFDLSTSTLAGGSPSSYVRTSGTGECRRNLAVGATTLFPIGRSTYNPAELVKSGSMHTFGVRVVDVVTSNAQDGGAPTTAENMKRMWHINPSAGYTAANGALSVSLIYEDNASNFLNNFSNDPADRQMFHFGSTWENITNGSFVTDDYSLSNYVFCLQPGVTNFSPFTISNFGAVLPVELVSFQANCKEDNSIAVTWTTASEHNTSHYLVEKSNDGITWSALGQTAAAGNSTQLLNYELIDSEKVFGTNYYRLTQFDNDGAFEVFDPVSVNCNEAFSNNHITTYPNPSFDGFCVSLFTETMEGDGQLTINDASGHLVYEKSVYIQDGNNLFHIEQLDAAPGLYYIKVSNGTITSKIVKHSLR